MYSVKNIFMKKYLKYTLLLFAIFAYSIQLKAQEDSTIVTKEEVVSEEASLISPSLELLTVQKADKTIDCRVKIQAKINGSFYKLRLLKVNIVNVTPEGDKPLAFAITDRIGQAVINVKGDGLYMDTEGKITLKAVFAGNKQMEATEAEVIIKRAMLVITPVAEDSVFSVQAKVVDISTGIEMPVPEATIGLFVKRQFNPLKIGEGTTDSMGEAVVEVPNNLPGNEKKNIILIAKIEENELYGNLEATIEQPWGYAVSNENKEAPRALWSNRVPIWMLLTFILLMSVVWGHYIVIIYELFRLRKEEPHTTA